MKRTPRVALWAALMALGALVGSLRPAAAAPLPNAIPNFVQPSLFEGFPPIEPDEFGLSPNFEFLVFEDEDGFHVIRLVDDVETFRLQFPQGPLTVGFDPADERLFLLEALPGERFRFRFIDPETGLVLRDDRLSDFPELRTNFDASVTVLAEPIPRRTRVEVLEADGRAVFRRTFSTRVDFALSAFEPAVAFLDPLSNGRLRVELLNAERGNIVLRETVSVFSVIGFAPFDSTFVVAQPVNSNNFRVRLVDALRPGVLTSRSFSGPVNAGFTPDGSLLGVVSRRGPREELFLLRTFDGRQVFAQ